MILNGKSIFFDENNTPFIIEHDKSSKRGLHRRYGEIKKCKYCNNKFFTYRHNEFCSNHCSHAYCDISYIVKLDSKIVYVTPDKKCFIQYKENGHVRKRFGSLKHCIACGKLFFADHKNHKFCSKHCMNSREFSYNWKGGITELSHHIRTTIKYYDWRNAVFNRDNYVCQMCGYDKGGCLEAHHIIPLSTIIHSNNLVTIDDAMQCDNLWNVDNGITLCKHCHNKIHYGGITNDNSFMC